MLSVKTKHIMCFRGSGPIAYVGAVCPQDGSMWANTEFLDYKRPAEETLKRIVRLPQASQFSEKGDCGRAKEWGTPLPKNRKI